MMFHNTNRSSNIFDNMLAIMEKYANRLEFLVEDRTNQLAEEKKKTETLLLTMLPKFVHSHNLLVLGSFQFLMK